MSDGWVDYVDHGNLGAPIRCRELMTYIMSVQVELSITLFALKYQPGVTLLGNY
jgi:hypothetical protein